MINLGPSPLNSQTSEPATTAVSAPTQYHHSMDSSSPSSSGKMMPSNGKGGKGGKPTSMGGLVRSALTQQHPGYYTGGKGSPTVVSGNNPYPMMMTHTPQPTQPWMPSQGPQQSAPQPPPSSSSLQSQQSIRYPPHGGKPMSYGPQRMSYATDPYMMRQQTPQVPPSPSTPYSYPSNIAPPSAYGHSQPMMPPQQSTPTRYPHNTYYSQPNPMSYPQQTPHRSLSQNSTSMPANGTMDLKPDDLFDDPSKSQQQQQQQQQMFQPLLQTRPRPQSVPYYSNMPPANNAYYSAQRPLTPAPDYNMSVGRGMRLPQQRGGYNDLSAGMNANIPTGLQSTPPPPHPPPPPSSVTPH